jgi:hypothetical protein
MLSTSRVFKKIHKHVLKILSKPGLAKDRKARPS